MDALTYESYVFDPRPRYPLLTTAKRYWHPQLFSDDPDALTLVFTHGTGFHKEQWEPTFEHLCELLERSGHPNIKLREIWSIDCPNHGDAAILNEEELSWGYSEVFGWEEYGRSVHAFLAGLGTGIPVDFNTRNLVGVGHSMGGVALTLANTFTPTINFKYIVLVEPMTYHKPPPGQLPAFKLDLAAGALKRRDTWPSRQAALESLESRPSFKIWDPRVLRVFVEQGLRDLPTALHPDEKEGVTLKCAKTQEAASYRDNLGRTRAYKFLGVLCSSLPVHFIYGEIDDYIPRDAKNRVLKEAARGKYASLTRVPKAGHLIVQMQPCGLANAIAAVLEKEAARASRQSKL